MTKQIEVTAKHFRFPFQCWFKSHYWLLSSMQKQLLYTDLCWTHFGCTVSSSTSRGFYVYVLTKTKNKIKKKDLTNVPCDNTGRRTEVGRVKGWQTEAVTRHFVKRKKERQKEEMTHKISAINLQLWCRPCVHLVDIRTDRKQNAGGDTLKKLPEERMCQLMCCCLMSMLLFFSS